MLLAGETVNKVVNSPRWKGRVCAGNPRRVSCAIEIISFQNFYKVLKTCSAGRKSFFAPLSGQQHMAAGRENFIFFAVLLTGSGSHTAPLRLRFFISPHDAFCTVRPIWSGPYSTELLQTEGYSQTSLQSLLNPVFSRIALISSTVRLYCQYLMSLTGFPFLKVPL